MLSLYAPLPLSVPAPISPGLGLKLELCIQMFSRVISHQLSLADLTRVADCDKLPSHPDKVTCMSCRPPLQPVSLLGIPMTQMLRLSQRHQLVKTKYGQHCKGCDMNERLHPALHRATHYELTRPKAPSPPGLHPLRSHTHRGKCKASGHLDSCQPGSPAGRGAGALGGGPLERNSRMRLAPRRLKTRMRAWILKVRWGGGTCR